MVESTPHDPFAWTSATVDGKYRVDALIGEGGFGVVYRAYHLGFGEKVALKCLRIPPTLIGAERDRFFASFLAEGRLLHQLSKATAGIVQALDVGGAISPNKAWTPYLVMEWLEGSTLEFEFRERRASGFGPRSLREGIELLDAAARALATAHEQGVAHRDIKPANLFLAEVGGRRTLKVLDFGIAKVMAETASMTRAFEATGSSIQAFTPRYGAPEQFSRRFGATGPWTDVFALALVFVEAVCGHSALDGGDASQLFVSATDTERRPTLRAHGIEVSDAVEDVLRTALAIDPKERYPNAGEFWDHLVSAAALSLPEDVRIAGPRSFQASSPGLQTTPDSAVMAASSKRRSFQSSPRTELTTSRQVNTDPLRSSLTPETRPTLARVAIAFGSATAVFLVAAMLGGLVWHRNDARVSPDPGGSAASVSAGPTASMTENGSTGELPRVEAPLPPPAEPGAVSNPEPPNQAPNPVESAAAPVPEPIPDSIPAPSSSAPVAPAPALPAVPGATALEVPEGRINGGPIWFASFRSLPRPADANKTFTEAHVSCAEAGMALCTETQWARVCSVHPSIAQHQAWTLSADANGVIVRGGGGDCNARSVVSGSERNPERGAVCCDRSVGINSSNKNTSFLMATAKRVLDVEKTLNQRNIPGFLDLLADPVGIDHAVRPKAGIDHLLEDSFKQWPDQWLISDVCGVAIHSTNTTVIKRTRHGHVKRKIVSSDTWSADCDQMRFRAGDIAVIETTYVFGVMAKVKSISDGEAKRHWSKP